MPRVLGQVVEHTAGSRGLNGESSCGPAALASGTQTPGDDNINFMELDCLSNLVAAYKLKNLSVEDRARNTTRIFDFLANKTSKEIDDILRARFPSGHRAADLVLLHGILENKGHVTDDIINN